MEPGVPLRGGFVSRVTRVGDTVRRTPGPDAGFVHRLLAHLESVGWNGAPRFLGSDEDGAEILTFVEGSSGAEPSVRAQVGGDHALAEVARLVRELHDLTAGTPLAGEQEVVCHHDLDPRNTVYRQHRGRLTPVALIDWDLSAPGRRVEDVAHLAWQFLPLGPDATDVVATARRLRLVADAYGLVTERDELVETVAWWQERCWRGIAVGAAAGDPSMLALRSTGAAEAVREAEVWTRRHRRALEAALES